jgi:hypothetical protein
MKAFRVVLLALAYAITSDRKVLDALIEEYEIS